MRSFHGCAAWLSRLCLHPSNGVHSAAMQSPLLVVPEEHLNGPAGQMEQVPAHSLLSAVNKSRFGRCCNPLGRAPQVSFQYCLFGLRGGGGRGGGGIAQWGGKHVARQIRVNLKGSSQAHVRHQCVEDGRTPNPSSKQVDQPVPRCQVRRPTD
jgi:hypothetical protein